MSTFNFFIESLKKKIKHFTEYRINFYSHLVVQPFYLLYVYTALLVVSGLNLISGWQSKDYIVFFLFGSYYCSGLPGIFTWRKSLRSFILDGDLNMYLIKPVHSFFQVLFFMSVGGLMSFVTNAFWVFIIAFIFSISFKGLILGLIVGTFIAVLEIALFTLTDTFNFFSFGLSDFFSLSYFQTQSMMIRYPVAIFDDEFYRCLLIFTNSFFIAYLVVPVVRGEMPTYFWSYFSILIALIVISFLLSFVIWHYGLKKYEAYN